MSFDDQTRAFLRKYGIPESDVFDAGPKPKSYWADAMQKAGKPYVYMNNPCRNGGHRLRNRHSACVVCYPHFLGFSAHHRAPGKVYVAVSRSTGFVKVGGTKATDERTKTLKRQAYGGVADWRVIFDLSVSEVGRIEALARADLSRYQVLDHIYRGDEKEAREMFKCSPAAAVEAVKRAAANDRLPTGKRLSQT